MPFEDQNVVHQPGFGDLPDSRVEVVPQNVIRIGLVLHHMPQSPELWILRQPANLITNKRFGQRHPADYPKNEVPICRQFQQPFSFTRSRRLYRDAAVDSRRVSFHLPNASGRKSRRITLILPAIQP